MVVKVEMCMEIEDDKFSEIKEFIEDYTRLFLNTEELHGIESVFGSKVTKVKQCNNQSMSKEDVHNILKDFGFPVSVFCRKLDISQTTYYQWFHDRLNLTADKEERIFNFAKTLAEVRFED